MKRKICGTICGVNALLVIGIVGGIDCGAPLSNGLWCFVLLGAMYLCARIGGFDK